MRFLVAYQKVSDGADSRREITVEAADEGSAYDQAMEQMREDEALIEVSPAAS